MAIITFHGGRLYVAHEIETGLTTYKEFKFFSTIDQLEVSRDFIEKTISAYLEKLKKEQKTSWYFLHKTKYPTVNFSFDKNPVQEGNFTEEREERLKKELIEKIGKLKKESFNAPYGSATSYFNEAIEKAIEKL